MSIKKAMAGTGCSLAIVVASFFGLVGEKVRISEEGLANLINCEGCERQAYKDGAGVPTAGVGSTIGIVMGRLYTDGEVAKMLAKDVVIAEQCLNRNVKVDLTQGEWDAYASFIFNIGCSGFVSSTTYRVLHQGNRFMACDAMRMWNKITVNGVKVYSKGVANRREKDRAICVKYL